MNRQPAVAGYFYPGNKNELTKTMRSLIHEAGAKKNAKGILVPHAGYLYSGEVAGKVYGAIELPDTFIILCPNHTGRGEDIAIMENGTWTTPLGEAYIDKDLSHLIMDNYDEIHSDASAHEREHSLEVQLPFLQYLKEAFTFVPICIRTHNYEKISQLGKALSQAIIASARNVLIIASSDMTHFESAISAEKKDQLAIEQMMTLNGKGLYDTIMSHGISMCGVFPATASLIALKELNCSRGELIEYTNSGKKTGDYSDVVAYAGMIFY
ncbi:MAG: AmmeMemoRadiSam system protein B [Candidatus Fischerbacteria bacterium RBG_13_37_8]|uniref:MEMO1 family protein A2Y62_17525 n=1 Tax=Candidatus Fischerbacteria bacterium RBG_13_37_8 TaxID=1817863 RepID=A0A1F5VP64_9BACT|nr:MAG: AmmeMemoRadiSam system protein B [Candidatus Fischerbacteria bacterium RBG_13_37_8]